MFFFFGVEIVRYRLVKGGRSGDALVSLYLLYRLYLLFVFVVYSEQLLWGLLWGPAKVEIGFTG